VCSASGGVKPYTQTSQTSGIWQWAFCRDKKTRANNHWDTHTNGRKEQTNKLWKLLAMNEWMIAHIQNQKKGLLSAFLTVWSASQTRDARLNNYVCPHLLCSLARVKCKPNSGRQTK
jgi:hypothetical protein